MILSGDIQSAKDLIKEKFSRLYEKSKKVQSYIDVLTFLHFISVGDIEGAVNFAGNLDKYISGHGRFYFPSKNRAGTELRMEVKDVLMLLCYPKPEKSELKFLVSIN